MLQKSSQVVYEAALCLLLRAKDVKSADFIVAKTEEMAMTVSGRARVALLRLKTMQSISDNGLLASLPPASGKTLSSCAHAYIHTRPIPGAPEEQDDDEPDPPVPQNMEALAHFIFTRIQKGRCALHAI